jgi:hypothetical protein
MSCDVRNLPVWTLVARCGAGGRSEVDLMSQASSPSKRISTGLAGVCHVRGVSQTPVYWQRQGPRAMVKRAGTALPLSRTRS